MNYEERLKKVIEVPDIFWYITLDKFIQETYEDKEIGLAAIEELAASDKARFGEFTRQVNLRKNDLQSVKNEFLVSSGSTNETNISIEKIIISPRIYNGHYSKGCVFKNIMEFNFNNESVTISTSMEFCINDQLQKKAKLEGTIPFIMNEDSLEKLKEIVKRISSNRDYHYNESHYSSTGFDPKKYHYTDVIINGKDYEIMSNDNILKELKTAINVDTINKVIAAAYESLIK